MPAWALEKDTLPYEQVPGLTQPGFYGMTVEIDADLGRLVQFLDRRGLRENTILIFATDNGGADGVKHPGLLLPPRETGRLLRQRTHRCRLYPRSQLRGWLSRVGAFGHLEGVS